MPTHRAWLNGLALAQAAVEVTSRGLHYGDGLFETMLRANGRIRLQDAHLDRLESGCRRLHMCPPAREVIEAELSALPGDGVVKLLVWRDGTGRGYRPDPASTVQRLLLLYPLPPPQSEIRVQWCNTRMGRNPTLAGLKHLNRLEQVLAQAELPADVDEGLMLDTSDEVVSATMGNLFLVREGALTTPRLDQCGVRGVMREATMRAAAELNMPVIEAALTRADVDAAEEIFITNAVRGIRAVIQLERREMIAGPVARQLSALISKL